MGTALRDMQRFRIIGSLVLLSLAVVGCKTSSPLAESEAQRQISSTFFAGPAVTQSVTFVSGAVEQHPYAIDQFLYAKHWSTCENTAGALETTPACSLDAEGGTYGHVNHWSVVETPTSGCGKCATWTIPVATAAFKSVQSIDVLDKTHANATYTYAVTPNEFGTSLGAWTAGHPLSWCGPDASAVGGWATTRVGHAAFEKVGGTWTLHAAPNATFADLFAVTGTSTGKVCAG